MLTPYSFYRTGGSVYYFFKRALAVVNDEFLIFKPYVSLPILILLALSITCVDPVQLGLRTYRCEVRIMSKYSHKLIFCLLLWNPRASEISSKSFWEQCFLCTLFFFLNYLFILLYNIVLVLPYIDLNPWVYLCSPS